MKNSQDKDLFHLQTELIQMKVDMAVNNTMDRVLAGIADLKGDIHQVEKRLTSLEHRERSNEATLHSVNGLLTEIRTKFIDYGFKAGWVVLTILVSFLFYQLHSLLK